MATSRFSSEHDYHDFLTTQAQWPDAIKSPADMYRKVKELQAKERAEAEYRHQKDIEKRMEEERMRVSRHQAIEAMRSSRKPGSAIMMPAFDGPEPNPKPSNKELLLLLEDV